MIGNDLVDLRQARRESNWRRPRYLEKIFTPNERQLILSSTLPETMLWLLWSCKEAAYKRWSSETCQRSYIPRKIVVSEFRAAQEPRVDHGQIPSQQYTCWVKIGDHRYCVETTLAGELIHSWTLADELKLLLCKVASLTPQQDLSQATSALLRRQLAQYFQWSPTDISIQKNEQGRPLLYYQNKQCDLLLSLTHHGRYGGFLLAAGGTDSHLRVLPISGLSTGEINESSPSSRANGSYPP